VASVQDIKRRLRSVRNTRKITKAMELVAGARLRRAEARITAMRPYAERMRELMIGTARAAGTMARLPLLEVRENPQSVAILILTGDRGLAGPFNAQVLRRAFALESEYRSAGLAVRWLVVGKKGRSTLAFRKYPIEHEWTGFTDRPEYHHASEIGHRIVELFTGHEADRVVMVFNHYISPLTQEVESLELLPVPRSALADEEEKTPQQIALEGDIIYEPEPEQILARLLPAYIETSIYRALLESTASEHGARMTAMRNASQNAGELIDSLTLDMNRARQAAITQELLEVVAGADALTQ
jgi:F-type H+-transporting ATPase subunit gamma